ncbi:4-hydroxy-3-methylbut-2-enyl diphosphate reductase [uncultured Campylobacter sp.]|uniref:4-hydroxy-3-methylbut-2-enyl diphosphate reductase n=1 Tax=uncultured Campylobacter sp. TaxID=218934 RepID=UPI0026075DB7|nr:4-hydroxy-3-methylbut-2-enyl diphosphate reductase [uncultured Campylobacter sp.]
MKIELAQNYGFCFGVKRAIRIAQNTKNAATIGELIHNNEEIKRLKERYGVKTLNSIDELKDEKRVIIRTHGIAKSDYERLKFEGKEIFDATCPFVTKPQQIVEEMSSEGYDVVIFGDEDHPEVKGVKSYAKGKVYVTTDPATLDGVKFGKVALISQTTKKIENFEVLVGYLLRRAKEVRVFNTICNATSQNQKAITELSQRADVMIVVGGKNSSNTKQLFLISKQFCKDSYHIENELELKKEWFIGKNLCGISAGASTPDWIIQKVIKQIESFV